jgi:GTP cyclohydrolase II
LTTSPLERAIAALRVGRPVQVTGPAEAAVLSVETGTQAMLDLLDPNHEALLLISGARAAALALGNDLHAADATMPVAISRAEWLDAATAQSICDPGQDLARGLAGPLTPVASTDARGARAALQLARAAGLLPALWTLPNADSAAAQVRLEDIEGRPFKVAIVSRASLPLEGMPATQIIMFRTADDGQEHVGLLVGAFGGKPPLVRLHSECLTGDVFGSLKCDCGPQLREALRVLGAAGGGILLYLRQEGRGIGIANKIRAYALQDRGLDTVDANQRLGFADDERSYDQAAAMLRALGAERIRLLTNNLSKVHGLEAAGIEVVERVPHQMPANPHNADYLDTKRKKSGHLG